MGNRNIHSKLTEDSFINIENTIHDDDDDDDDDDDKLNEFYDYNNNYFNKKTISKSKSESESICFERKLSIQQNNDKSSIFSSSWSPDYSPKKGRNLADMSYFYGWFYRLYDSYKEINPATLTGAIDVVVVRQEDGSYRSSPFHVRFGKFGVFKSKQNMVDVEINGKPVDLHMLLGEAGEGFFVEQIPDDEESGENFENIYEDESALNRAIASQIPSNHTPLTKTQSQPIPKEKTPLITPDLSIPQTAPIAIPNALNKDDGEKLPLNASPSLPILVSSFPEDLIDNSNEIINKRNPTNYIEFGNVIVTDCTNIINLPPNDSNSSDGYETPAQAFDQPKSSIISANNNESAKAVNYFSDGDLTPELTSPTVSRPPTPKSDTEVEIQKSNESKINTEWNWNWGELPERTLTENIKRKQSITSNQSPRLEQQTTPLPLAQSQSQSQQQQITSPTKKTKSESEKKGTLSMITSLMSSKKTNELADGVYLGDLSDKLDSEMAALYINPKTYYKPIQPIVQIKDEDQDSGSGHSLPQSPVPTKEYSILNDLQISLCGGLNNLSNTETFEELFQQYLVSYDRFQDEIATITANPDLVIKLNGRYLNWQAASPIILSAIIFHKQLPNDTINQIVDANMPKPKVQAQVKTQPPTPQQPQNQTPAIAQGKAERRSWLGFLKPNTTTTTTTTTTLTVTKTSTTTTTTTKPSKPDEVDSDTSISNIITPESISATQIDATPSTTKQQTKPKTPRYRRVTRLSSEFIKKLDLKPGANEIAYSVTTKMQGTTRIQSFIFLWNYDDKIIVSDIDGTITKSDVLGQVLPIFGKDWTQHGIADLFSAIEANSYKFVYLSARAIGQSKITRSLLRNINQDGLTLPEGPLLVTPSSLFTAFQKEVIEKKPHEFKICCLEDIKSLFPRDRNPFYAGYGNRINDVIAYKTVGIPLSRIFTINPRGELKHEVSQTFQSSYSNLCTYVDQIFPPIKPSLNQTEYSSFNYWKDPLPAVELEELDLATTQENNNNNKTVSSKKSDKTILNTSIATTSTSTSASIAISTTNTLSTKPTMPSKSSSSTNINIDQDKKPNGNDRNNNNLKASTDDIDLLSKSL